MTVSTAKRILDYVSEWNGESALLVQVNGTDFPVEGIESEDVNSDGSERVVRIMLVKTRSGITSCKDISREIKPDEIWHNSSAKEPASV